MDIQQLKMFCGIAQSDSLVKAAQRMHISQPSLSRNLRALEDELGCQLFDRVGRNLVLNDAGRFMLKRATSILDSVDSVKLDIDQFIHDGNLSVDLYSPVPMGATEDIIIGFKRRYPNVRLRIAAWPDEDLKNVQPSITFFASSTIHRERNYLMLGEESISLAVARSNPLSRLESVKLADLSDQSFITVLPSSPLYKISSAMFTEAGFDPIVAAADQEADRILAYVANDFGVAIAPEITWFGHWRREIASVPFSDVRRMRYLYLKWPDDTVMNWATLRFRDYMIEHFNKTYGFTCSIDQPPSDE